MFRTNFSSLQLATSVAVALATVFVVFGGFAHGFTMRNVAWLAISGAIFGAIGAPWLEPKAFRYPTLWQIFFSVFGCLLLAGYLQSSAEGYALAAGVGIILGYLAPYWVKHVQVP